MRLRLPPADYIAADGHIFEAHRLVKLHRSWALVLPKAWVTIFARDGWVVTRYDPEANELIVRAPTDDEQEVLDRHGTRSRKRGH